MKAKLINIFSVCMLFLYTKDYDEAEDEEEEEDDDYEEDEEVEGRERRHRRKERRKPIKKSIYEVFILRVPVSFIGNFNKNCMILEYSLLYLK